MLQVALPELDGAMEPIVFAGRDSNTGKSHSLPDRITLLCNRAVNWARLRKKKNAEKKLAITVFRWGVGCGVRRAKGDLSAFPGFSLVRF